MAILRQLELHDPPAPSRINPSVAPRLSALIARLLAKDPGGRPPSAKQVVDELDAIANDLSAEPTVIRPAMPAPPLRIGIASIFRKISPRSAWAFGGSAAFIVGILLTWQFLTSNVAQKKALSPLALVSDPAKIKGLQSWTLETANQRGKFHWLKYSLDGKLLASGGEDGTVRLWEPSTGKLAKILVTGTEVRHPAWSPDSKSLGAWHDGKYWASMKHTMHWSDEPDLSATIISAWQPGRQWGASKPAM